MAKEAPKKDELVVDAPPPKKSKKMLFIIGGVVVAAVVAGVGVGLTLGGSRGDTKKPDAVASEELEDDEVPGPTFDPKKPPVFVNLEPFTVNLQPENGEQFLQVVTTLRVADDKVSEQLKLYMPQIRHEILSLMSSKKASEITTPDGRQYLAEDIRDVSNDVLGYKPPKRKKASADSASHTGPVVAVFFTQFIVQ